MKKIIGVFLMIVLFAGASFAQSASELVEKGNRLLAQQDEPAALEQYEAAIALDANNYDALCGASLMLSKIGNRMASNDQKTPLFRKADKYAGMAIEANPNDAEGYYVKSVAMGRIALIAGTKERVAASTAIKDNADKAIKLDGKHPGAWYVLGRWNIKVANLSFAERAAANVLFGGLPEGASNENAVKCFTTAHNLDTDYILYMYDLAGAYTYSEKYDEAKTWLNKALATKAVTMDDPNTHEECKKMLALIANLGH